MPRQRPRSQPRPLAEALLVALRKAGLSQTLQSVEVLRRWPEVVGPEMARQTWPEILKDGALVVATTHPAWRHELHFRQEEILTRLAEVLGPGTVKAISTVVRTRRGNAAPEVKPRAEAVAFGDTVANPVDDDLLRDAIRRAAAANAEARYRGRLA
ncbi:MAG: DUF721 domain-containing protein [Myxococcota bacterium]